MTLEINLIARSRHTCKTRTHTLSEANIPTTAESQTQSGRLDKERIAFFVDQTDITSHVRSQKEQNTLENYAYSKWSVKHDQIRNWPRSRMTFKRNCLSMTNVCMNCAVFMYVLKSYNIID